MVIHQHYPNHTFLLLLSNSPIMHHGAALAINQRQIWNGCNKKCNWLFNIIMLYFMSGSISGVQIIVCRGSSEDVSK
ncbi:hypothetical protein, partial [Escherichia coli]|uniref:hypothetical protein n=1 Tax=Escherichia coli TaxID=562 RepID=UPI001BE5FD52